MKVIRNTADY